MKDRPAYLPLYVRDFLTDPKVLAMAWLEQAIYLRMLMMSWEAGPLPGDPVTIERMIGLGADHRIDPSSASIEAVLAACWQKTEEGWINPRLESERERWRRLDASNKARTAAANAIRTSRSSSRQRDDERNGAKAQAQAQAQEEELRTRGRARASPAASSGGSRGEKKSEKTCVACGHYRFDARGACTCCRRDFKTGKRGTPDTSKPRAG
jgi:uncharacterized protein YdaU (DUF1376 family)